MHKNRLYIKMAAILGAMAVVFGAFGSHLLREKMTPDTQSTWETAVSFQFYHALGLLAVGILYKRYHSHMLVNAGRFIFGGTIFFSGSLYMSTILTMIGLPGLGMFSMITPIGGVALFLGWVCLFLGMPGNWMKKDAEEKD
ncbi:MAG: DUF423 domain-containing protein [Bacteroidetes bacterium]|nr:DUF423 domain-containing protein [Bacteroidota bacterium]